VRNSSHRKGRFLPQKSAKSGLEGQVEKKRESLAKLGGRRKTEGGLESYDRRVGDGNLEEVKGRKKVKRTLNLGGSEKGGKGAPSSRRGERGGTKVGLRRAIRSA